MPRPGYATLVIDAKVHGRLVQFCKERGTWLKRAAERAIEQYISDEMDKPAPKRKGKR